MILAAADRLRVEQALLRLDEGLGSDPRDYGESREGGVRIPFARPLACTFSVDESVKRVYLHAVWRY